VTQACAGAALLWIESPTNPLLQVADLPAVIAGAHRSGTRVVVDNTFATPILQRPLDDGADIVLHSVSKSLSGHSDLLLGALVASDPALADAITERRILLGASPSPFDCYLALRGIRTLAVRVERAQDNARVLAGRLAGHASVSRVRYPGFGSMIAIEHADGPEAAEATCGTVTLWTHATSLGGVESLLERRRRWSGESDQVPESLIRLSVGIENVDELWADLEQALSRR
jgi:cystathionine gamma-synthase